MPEKPYGVHMIGDSQCTISALESRTAILGSFFANQILELESTRSGWVTLVGQDLVVETDREVVMAMGQSGLSDPVFHTPGDFSEEKKQSQEKNSGLAKI